MERIDAAHRLSYNRSVSLQNIMKYKAAIILAGGEGPQALRQSYGVSRIAELPFGPTRIIDRVVTAFREANFDEIVTVGSHVDGCIYAEAGKNLLGSLTNGLNAIKSNGTLFVATCDTPFLTASELLEFAKKQRGSTFYCSVVPVQACKDQFPNLARTALKTAEGELTFGNVVAAERWVWNRALPLVQRAFKARKSKPRLALMMGLPTSVRYLLAKRDPRHLSIEHLELRARKLIKCEVRAIIGSWPGIGTDIDTIEHYQEALQHLPVLELEPV